MDLGFSKELAWSIPRRSCRRTVTLKPVDGENEFDFAQITQKWMVKSMQRAPSLLVLVCLRSRLGHTRSFKVKVVDRSCNAQVLWSSLAVECDYKVVYNV